MTVSEQYAAKKCSVAEAIAPIQDHNNVLASNVPVGLFDELLAQRERFTDLHVFNMLGLGPSDPIQNSIYSPDAEGHFSITCGFIGEGEHMSMRRGRVIEHSIMHFSDVEDVMVRNYKPAYVLCHVPPMDEDGYFTMGLVPGAGRACIDAGAKPILQVNPNMPVLNTDYNKIHISEVLTLCELDYPVRQVPDRAVGELEQKIAAFITERVPDGATIQFGVGTVPAAMGVLLRNHKHLGIHTEVFTRPLMELVKAGAVDNSQKSVFPGVAITGFVEGSPEIHAFVNNNKDILSRKLSWVNSPFTIAQNKAMVSVNSCLGVDLRGQVCSESLGTSIFGAAGGQLDFVRGARHSEGGQSYIAMRSQVEKKDGTCISKITFTLPEGSVITTPRNDVMNIVTEYGVAELFGRTTRERALALIAVAHPQFREDLTFQAKKHGLI